MDSCGRCPADVSPINSLLLHLSCFSIEDKLRTTPESSTTCYKYRSRAPAAFHTPEAGQYMSKKSHEDLPLPLSNFSPVRFSAVYGFENKNKYKFSTKPSFPRQISSIPRFSYCNLQKMLDYTFAICLLQTVNQPIAA
ncbi:C-type lectin BiL [Trichinella spiralis]|uniref:C-type lectin BiL n=1 Tax=Trichinella spiralis TaxID=6334 RepID=A0ABR3KTF8_TRISP